MELTKNNISTISVFIYMMVSPLLIRYGILIDDGTFTTLISGVIGLFLATWSSKNPNNMKVLGNDTEKSC